MRKHWLLIGTAVVAGALALGAIACSDDDDDGDADQPTATEASGATVEPTAAETAEATSDGTPSAEAIEVPLAAVDASGVTGTATLAATDGGGTEVSITIDGGLTEGDHQNHIHGPGTCAGELADVEETLTTLTADATGAAGPTTTTLTDDPEHFQDGTHYFAVHGADGAVVACGDIPTA